MPVGSPIDRQWVIMLQDGRVVIDWGDDLYQDLAEGTFFTSPERLISHNILDDELDVLIRAGLISQYDAKKIYFHNLPERPQNTIE